jgi:hypothetical protein
MLIKISATIGRMDGLANNNFTIGVETLEIKLLTVAAALKIRG